MKKTNIEYILLLYNLSLHLLGKRSCDKLSGKGIQNKAIKVEKEIFKKQREGEVNIPIQASYCP